MSSTTACDRKIFMVGRGVTKYFCPLFINGVFEKFDSFGQGLTRVELADGMSSTTACDRKIFMVGRGVTKYFCPLFINGVFEKFDFFGQGLTRVEFAKNSTIQEGPTIVAHFTPSNRCSSL